MAQFYREFKLVEVMVVKDPKKEPEAKTETGFITQEAAWKLNLINIVKEHRDKCDRTCSVSLYMLMTMAEKAGLEFTKEERELFF